MWPKGLENSFENKAFGENVQKIRLELQQQGGYTPIFNSITTFYKHNLFIVIYGECQECCFNYENINT